MPFVWQPSLTIIPFDTIKILNIDCFGEAIETYYLKSFEFDNGAVKSE